MGLFVELGIRVAGKAEETQPGSREGVFDVLGPEQPDLGLLDSAVGILDLYRGAVAIAALDLEPRVATCGKPVRIGELESEPAVLRQVRGCTYQQLRRLKNVGGGD